MPDHAHPDEMQRITRLSIWMFRAVTVLTYVLPLIVIVTILRGVFDPQILLAQYPQLVAGTRISPVQSGLVVGVAVVSVLPMIAAFLSMASLFGRYGRGEILSDGSAEDILRIGRAMVCVAAMTVLVPTLQVLVLSWNAPQRTLQIALDGGTFGFLVSAGLLTVIGWVMREAARLKAENEAFV